jgi:YD repeat-containing protein
VKKYVWLFIMLILTVLYGQNTLAASVGYVDEIDADMEPSIIDPKTLSLFNPYEMYFLNNKEKVSPASGSLSVEVVDLLLPGRDGLDLEIKRTYNSVQAQSDEIKLARAAAGYNYSPIINGFGPGWHINIPYLVRSCGSAPASIYLPDGNTFEFLDSMEGLCVAYNLPYLECHDGNHFHFSAKLEDDKYIYTLVTNDGTKYLFDNDGRLTFKISPNGTNKIQYFYNGKEIEKIIDSVGREVTFTYKDVGAGRLIESIQVGRKKISYNYDQNGLLWQVTNASNSSSIWRTEYTNTSYGPHEAGSSSRIYTYTLYLLDKITIRLEPPPNITI